MNNSKVLAFLIQPVNSLLVRLLIMALGFFHVGLLMWEPTEYADLIDGFSTSKSLLLIWAMCSSMVVGIGFHPRKTLFKLIFNPYSSLLILIVFTLLVCI